MSAAAPPGPADRTPAPSPPPSRPARVSWELVLQRAWRKVALTFAAALSLASIVWQLAHRDLIYPFVFHLDAVAAGPAAERFALVKVALVSCGLAAILAARVLRRVRRDGAAGSVHRETFLASLVGLPLLTVPTFEYEHPLFTFVLVAGVSAALAWVIARQVGDRRLPRDLTRRQALLLVGAAVAVFTGVVGFISHWRLVTFHAEVCDSSWETNSIWGIVHHGIPTISVGAYMYDGKTLPSPYFNNHVPFGDYLYAPFFALVPDVRTILWAQAAYMGAGAIGAYLLGRAWFGGRLAGVVAAWLYVLNPSVQSLCLHDIHPNILVIPALVLAVGFMESGRTRAAVAFALVAAICHEETPLYAGGLGLAWMLSTQDVRRFRVGLGLCVASVGLLLLFSAVLMPAFGGHPRWEHFRFFFDERRSGGSLVGALVLDPLGAAIASTSDYKIDYLLMSLLPLGGVALFGWRMGWTLLPAGLLLIPAATTGFFTTGMNYSTPLVPVALLMGAAGVRNLWERDAFRAPGRRAGLATYVIVTAIACNYLYGNIASKTFKIEYGEPPFRRQNQYSYRRAIGYVDALPPFGAVERGLWDVIAHVPPKAPILTSWLLNPALATREISLSLHHSFGTPPPEKRVAYVVIDKLPQIVITSEADIIHFRGDPDWHVFYENDSGVIFERATPRPVPK